MHSVVKLRGDVLSVRSGRFLHGGVGQMWELWMFADFIFPGSACLFHIAAATTSENHVFKVLRTLGNANSGDLRSA